MEKSTQSGELLILAEHPVMVVVLEVDRSPESKRRVQMCRGGYCVWRVARSVFVVATTIPSKLAQDPWECSARSRQSIVYSSSSAPHDNLH